MFKPNKTDNQFIQPDYALYSSAWIMLTEGITRQYKIGFADCRLICGIEALIRLYGHRLSGRGITAVDIARITSFHRKRVTRMLIKTIRGRTDTIYRGNKRHTHNTIL